MTQNISQFSYFAFISYSSADERWARWLHTSLEHYSIPTAICRENASVPKHLRPVFWYKKDLSGVQLKASLEKELAASRFLIVICSPAAAKSQWVNDEVQSFVTQGRIDHIIPFIVDGEPNAADPARECFPVALRNLPHDSEIRGINPTVSGRRHALVDVVATMLGVRFDTLWQRHQRRRRIIRNSRIAAAVLAVAVAAGIYDYTRTRSEYYADWVDRYGVPEGIIPLDDDTRSHRNSYRFEYRRIPFGEKGAWSWRLAQVSYVHPSGTIIDIQGDNKGRYPITQISYSAETGDVTRLDFADRYGKVQLRHNLSERDGVPAAIADFVAPRESQGSAFGTGKPTDDTKRSAVVRYAYTRDSNGHITGKSFHCNNDYNLTRSAIPDENGVYAIDYTLDSLGRVTRKRYLDADKRPTYDQYGISTVTYDYAPLGAVTMECNRDSAGALVYDKKMIAAERSITDRYGRVIEQYELGPDSMPAINKDWVAKYQFVRDDDGNIIEQLHFGADGKPCINSNYVARYVVRYDSRGNRIEQYNYGIDGALTLDQLDQCASGKMSYDKSDRCIRIDYYGIDGKPCITKEHIATIIRRYDDRGNEIETSYLDTDGNPCIGVNGYYKDEYSYDRNERLTSIRMFDIDGSPTYNKRAFHQLQLKYDERGNIVEASYLDIDGKPTVTMQGYATIRMKYDEQGNMTEIATFDEFGAPCIGKDDGSAATRYEFDLMGNITSFAYYDVSGQPTMSSVYGFHKQVNEYDRFGHNISRRYYDTDQKACLDKRNVWRSVAVYDIRGNMTDVAYYGIDNRPIVSSEGLHRRTAEYDNRGNRTVMRHFDADNRPCFDMDGAAARIYEYDDRGNMIAITELGTDGRPVSANGVVKHVCDLDSHNNIIKVSTYDANGRLCNGIYGYAVRVDEYDIYDRVTLQSFYDADNRPVIDRQNGAHGYRTEYDRFGHMTRIAGIGTDGRPAPGRNGNYETRCRYDRFGNVVESANYDQNSQPMLTKDGIHIERITYNKQGQCITVSNYGVDGKPCLSNDGWHSLRNHYSGLKWAGREYFGLDSAKVEPYGYHRSEIVFDKKNKQIASRLYDAHGRVTTDMCMTFLIQKATDNAMKLGVPENSILLQLNDWKIGDAVETCGPAHRGRENHIAVLTPEGEIKHFDFPPGRIGLTWIDYNFPSDQARELRAKL